MTENTVGSLDFGVPRFNPDGSFAAISFLLDVTEHKLAEERLSSVSRRLIEAHEENAPGLPRASPTISTSLAFPDGNSGCCEAWPTADAAEASRSIGEVREQIKDLGNDIQALSLVWHSSKLDYLGAASEAFCREFSERQEYRLIFVAKAFRNCQRRISPVSFGSSGSLQTPRSTAVLRISSIPNLHLG